jgi:hypothetical protein
VRLAGVYGNDDSAGAETVSRAAYQELSEQIAGDDDRIPVVELLA